MAAMATIRRKRAVTAAALALAAALATVSAAAFRGNGPYDANGHFLAGLRDDRGELAALFLLLDAPGTGAEGNFAVVREISANFFRAGEYGRLIRFLGGRTVTFPDDPYNAHHLLMIAYAHMRQGSAPVAAMYFDMILNNWPDMTVNGSSIHLTCLLQLVDLTDDPRRQVRYYRELISRFPGDINLGVTWFRLAGAYGRIGEWPDAMRAYSAYLALGSPPVPGFPGAANHARRQVNFSNSARDWTFESLDALAAAVRSALDNNNVARMVQMQARTNFFTRSWGQGDVDSRHDFLIARYFGPTTRVRHADRFHEKSGSSGAYLRTWGWPQVISVWYLYFRQIDFPADPAVHGRWEWAGIYFGNSF